MSLDLVRKLPRLLHVVHVSEGQFADFAGEGPLHIAAVNRQEQWFLDALKIAYADAGEHDDHPAESPRRRHGSVGGRPVT